MRCKQAGLDPEMFPAHGLRSGYLTEAANCGIFLPDMTQQSLHQLAPQAASYYNNAERKMARAAQLIVCAMASAITLLPLDAYRRYAALQT